jgi:hypothetical protein
MANHEGCRKGCIRWHHEKVLAAFLGASLLAGCTTSAPDYRPRGPGGLVGYSDLQLAPNVYRVSFSGSSASTRDDVEIYLLRRAAEVTLQAGYSHFGLRRQDTERSTRYIGDSYLDGPYYYYPYRSWYWSYPYWPGDAWPVDSYSTYAEVVMYKSDEAANHPEAIDALSLVQRLQPPLPIASATQSPRS